jgi:hypothetical protein
MNSMTPPTMGDMQTNSMNMAGSSMNNMASNSMSMANAPQAGNMMSDSTMTTNQMNDTNSMNNMTAPQTGNMESHP